MDLNRVIGEVAARHGVRLDPDDPALVLVTVTELMLQQAQQEFLASARRATAKFVEAAERAQEKAGVALAESIRKAAETLCTDLDRVRNTQNQSLDSPLLVPLPGSGPLPYWWVVSALARSCVFG